MAMSSRADSSQEERQIHFGNFKMRTNTSFSLAVNARVVLNGNRVENGIIAQKLSISSEAKINTIHTSERERKEREKQALPFGGRIKMTDVITRLETEKVKTEARDRFAETTSLQIKNYCSI